MRNYYIYNMTEQRVIELDYASAMTYSELEYLDWSVDTEINDGTVMTDIEYMAGYIVVNADRPEYAKMILDHEIGHILTGHRTEDGRWRNGSEVDADAHAVELNGLERVLTLLHDTHDMIEQSDDDLKATALKELRQRIRKLKNRYKHKK